MQASFNHSFTVKFRNELQKNLELNLPSNPLPHFANIESSVIQLYIKVIQSQSYLLYMSTRECSDADSTVPLKLRPYGAIEILLLLLFFNAHQHKAAGVKTKQKQRLRRLLIRCSLC